MDDTMKKFLQKQPYKLTVARHNLGIHQMRIMARTIQALEPYMPEWDNQKNSYKEVEYGKKLNDVEIKLKTNTLVKNKNFRPLRDALEGLMKKVVRIYQTDDSKHFMTGTYDELIIGAPLIQSYKYSPGRDEIKLEVNGYVLPQLIDLARGYTRYSLDVAFKTSSPNTMKLYQYMSNFRDQKQIVCRVDTFRKWLQVEDKYSTPAKIKEHILEPAIKELKKVADVWFDIAERITKGRKMLGWKFNIYTKKNAKEKKEVKEYNQELLKRLTEKFKLSDWQAKLVLEKVPEKEIHKTVYQIFLDYKDNKITNLGAITWQVFNEKHNLKK